MYSIRAIIFRRLARNAMLRALPGRQSESETGKMAEPISTKFYAARTLPTHNILFRFSCIPPSFVAVMGS